MRALIYTRLSRDHADQTSTDDQERECRTLAARLGTAGIEVFPEQPGTSGYKDVERPEFDRLMSSLQSGDVVLAWALDRLTRKGMEQAGMILRLLEAAGAYLITVSDGIDTSRGDTDINVGVRAIIAREYSKGISKNVTRGKATSAAAGKWGGGPRWYGYANIQSNGRWLGPIEVDPAEYKVLREIGERYAAGERSMHIAVDLNSRSVPTVTGSQWVSGNMQHLVLHRRYVDTHGSGKGTCIQHGVEYEGTWPAIFTELEWQAMEASRLQEQRQRNWPKGRTGARSYLLTGFVYCERCGGKMTGMLKTRQPRTREPYKQRRYTCKAIDNRGVTIGCGKTHRNADAVELLITEAVLYRFDSPTLAKALTPQADQGKVQELLDRQHTVKGRIEEVTMDYYTGVMRGERALFEKAKAALDGELERLDRAVQELMMQGRTLRMPVGQTLREAWEAGTLDWRRELLALVIEKVVIQPQAQGYQKTWNSWRFDPDCVQVKWRA